MNYLYDIIIQSLVFIYDILYTLLYRMFEHPVIAIIAMSVVINFIVLPLYQKADALQKEEQSKKTAMAPWVKHIRKHFRGDERFMMLQAYYKVEHYSPLYSLREAVPLLLQIPFFMAAYRFLSTLPVLNVTSFGPIENLMKPDQLLVIGGFAVNVLPILMTLINLLSGTIYAQGCTKGLKVQILLTALVFLILLYNSPSGLVIYWTINNLFSLGKNLYSRLGDRAKKTIRILLVLILLGLIGLLTVHSRIKIWFFEIVSLSSFAYIVFQLKGEEISANLKKRFPVKKEQLSEGPNAEKMPLYGIAFASELALAVVLGLYIPSTVLLSSVHEFMDTSTGVVQYQLLTFPACVYIGLFLIWSSVVFFSKGKKGKKVYAILLMGVMVFALLNQFVFAKSFGTLYIDLKFDGAVTFSLLSVLINVAAGIVAVVVCALLVLKRPKLARNISVIIAAALLIISVHNVFSIDRKAKGTMETNHSTEDQVISYNGLLKLSKTGKNVIVMMLDRAIGLYVPFIFEEKPELMETFEGFVYYPNTASYAMVTNLASPALFGGYEYSPTEMNKRDTESLADKHNEALKVMPVMFADEGYRVTITDPPYAGYQNIPDLSIYNDYPEISAYNLKGKLSARYLEYLGDNDFDTVQKRHFVTYSLYRTAPLFLRAEIYDDGEYLSLSLKGYYSSDLIDSYSVLAMLTDLTAVDDDGTSRFLLLQNMTPHNPVALTPPDYSLNNTDLKNAPSGGEITANGRTVTLTGSDWEHYCINAATYRELAKWLDYLRQEGVYDNTRIIFVSDHGYVGGAFSEIIRGDGLDVQCFNPLLMVKDYDAHEPLSVNTAFMTNADVPYLATKDVIEDPTNPFTGNAITEETKTSQTILVTDSKYWNIEANNGNVFDTFGANWWSVKDNIFDLDNWELVE